MGDALWQLIEADAAHLADMLIFLPSRRAVRAVEKMIAARMGGAAILPRLVALGEGDDDTEIDAVSCAGVASNMARVVTLARLLVADANIGNLSTALPVARDLVRMWDYLENEGVDASAIDWTELVDVRYAAHFQGKAQILNILTRALPAFFAGRDTVAARRNRDIRAWRNSLDKYRRVVVCCSTASVPATADLMLAVAAAPHGQIILPGKISGCVDDFALNTNPYNSEYKFLQRAGISPDDLIPIDVGGAAIDFMNVAFGNDVDAASNPDDVRHCCLINCAREAEEAAVVAEIASRAVRDKKSVLVITPDAAGNQRIRAALDARGCVGDFSGGVSGAMTAAGRAILNVLDDWAERGDTSAFDRRYMAAGFDLFDTIATMVDDAAIDFAPAFDIDDSASGVVWTAIKELSDCLNVASVQLTLADARAFIADALSGVSIRAPMDDAARVAVLGTIESRMQTADVVILTGLNEGMFPARGYENAWLPLWVTEKIGLPSPDRKVSLQALDFMNLSCGTDVYWTRSCAAGGVQTTESRFLSRVRARGGNFDVARGDEILAAVRAADTPVMRPLDYSAPTPPADWSDVYVTEIETLIHNPYAFYARHILRLHPRDDYWLPPDARAFGNLVHETIEYATDFSPDTLIAEMDRRALALLGTDNVIFHFWHRRFTEIAPVVSELFAAQGRGHAEIRGVVEIAGRRVRAIADRVWDGMVMDIKTGGVPSKKQLMDGNMPQLPLEAFMLQSGGFDVPMTLRSQTPVMMFLQLRNANVRTIEYDVATTRQMMNAAIAKVTDLFNMYSAGAAPYEYRETGEAKYKAYDDLARIMD